MDFSFSFKFFFLTCAIKQASHVTRRQDDTPTHTKSHTSSPPRLFVRHFTRMHVVVQGLAYLHRFSSESHSSSKSSLASAALHQGWRLPGYQKCISGSDKALALVPAQQHPIINKSSEKRPLSLFIWTAFLPRPWFPLQKIDAPLNWSRELDR